MSDTAIATGKESALAYRTSGLARASIAGVLWSFANVSVTILLTFVVFMVTSRVLSPTDFGTVALAVAIVSMAGTVVPLGFGEALIQRSDLDARHTDSLFWLTMVLGVVIAGSVVLLSPVIARIAEVPLLAAILPILALKLIFDAGVAVPSALITRRMEFRYFAIRTTMANGISSALCLWLVLHGFALWSLVFAQIAQSLTGLVVTLFAARWRPRLTFSRKAIGDLGRFGLYSMGGRFLNEARFDQLILGLTLGPASLGLYFFARRLFQMLRDLTSGVFSPVTNVLLASLKHDVERRREFYLSACFASAFLSFPVFSGFLAIAPTAIPHVFGAHWTGAIFPVQCFAVIGLMAGLGVMQAGLIRFLGEAGWWFWYQSAMQLSTVPIVIVLYPLGLNAIMAAIVLRTLLLWPVSVMKAQNMLGITLATYLRSVAAPALAAVAMALVVSVLPLRYPQLSPNWLLAAQVGGGAAIYGSVAVALSYGRLRKLWARLQESRGRPT